MSSKNKLVLITSVVFVLVTIIFLTQVGFYSIQPIGAVPQGTTWLVWCNTGEPFFNSADRVSLDRLGSVSLFSRGIDLVQAPKERIIIKLPYW